MAEFVGDISLPGDGARSGFERLRFRVARFLGVQPDTRRIVFFALSLRVVTAFLALLANTVFPLKQPEQFTVLGRTHLWWDTFARYDSGWFLGIARSGYLYVEGGRNNLAFFPVYPVLMRYVGRLFGHGDADYYFGGVIVSWSAFVGAMLLLHRVALLHLPRRAAWRAVVYAAVFPFAFFYGVVYSESLFLFLLLASVYGLETKRWWLGGLAGALASSTRIAGVLALPALALVAWQAAGSDPRQRAKALGAVGLAACGVIGFSMYGYWLSGSLFEWAASVTRWNYVPGRAPFTPVFAMLGRLLSNPYGYLTSDPMAPYDALNGLMATVFIAAIPWVWRRFGAGYAVLMLVNLWVPLSSGVFEGLGRYCAVLFPMFLWLATFRSQQVQGWILATSGMLYMLCLALFTGLHPIF